MSSFYNDKMAILNDKKNDKKYICEICNFKSSKKTDYNRHILTAKHKKLVNDDKKNEFYENYNFNCICGKIYKFRQGLYVHQQKCKYNENKLYENKLDENKLYENKLDVNKLHENKLVCQLINKNNEFQCNLIKENEEIRKENKELKQQILELLPKLENITNNITNNNTITNNKFNINVFLNEKCKDAMSIDEFVKNIEISIKNLLTTKSKGIGIGINEIISENMNKLSIYERPIHCTDKKRETLYIKNDTWQKDVDKTHTSTMLKALQSQQFKAMKKWIAENPNYNDDEELKHQYMILVNKCSSSLNDHEKKLFKNICESTYIKEQDTFL